MRGAPPGPEVVATLRMEVNAIITALNAPPAPFVPEQHHFAPGNALLLAGFNGTQDHAQVVTRIREALANGGPDVRRPVNDAALA